MNKAIQYREDGKFYGLVNLPLEKDYTHHVRTALPMPFFDKQKYDEAIEACIAAGKEIINPEVMTNLVDSKITYYEWIKSGKADIFDCPDNIEFEEEEVDTVEDGGGCFVAGSKAVIYLKLKEEVKLTFNENNELISVCSQCHKNQVDEDNLKGVITKSKICRQCKEINFKSFLEVKPVETQDYLLGELMNIIAGHLEWEDGEITGFDPIGLEADLKSKFTIQRNKNV